MHQVTTAIANLNSHIINWVISIVNKRCQLIYRNLKILAGKNVYNTDFNECKPAMIEAKSFFKTSFSEFFPPIFKNKRYGDIDYELNKLISHYSKNPTALQYLNGVLKLVQPPTLQTAPSGLTQIMPTNPENPATGAPIHYVSCEESPFNFGCKNEKIRQIQTSLGMELKYQTGNFGPITTAKLKEAGYNVDSGGSPVITDQIYNAIIANCGKIGNTTQLPTQLQKYQSTSPVPPQQ